MDTKRKATDDGESSRPSVSPLRVASPPPTHSAPPMPSSIIQLEDDQIRKISSQVAEELRIQHSMDQTQIAQLLEMIQQGFEKITQEMSLLSTRVSRIEDHIKQLDSSRND